MNLLVMSNLATLTAKMALRSAVALLEELAHAMDVKLDRLLEDNRARTTSLPIQVLGYSGASPGPGPTPATGADNEHLSPRVSIPAAGPFTGR